jgi:hypothetical protein
MEIDHDKIDEAVLALMWLTLHGVVTLTRSGRIQASSIA